MSLLFRYCYSKESDDKFVAIAFCFDLVVTIFFFCCIEQDKVIVAFFCFGFVVAKKVMTMSKKKMTTSITFFDGFVAKKW